MTTPHTPILCPFCGSTLSAGKKEGSRRLYTCLSRGCQFQYISYLPPHELVPKISAVYFLFEEYFRTKLPALGKVKIDLAVMDIKPFHKKKPFFLMFEKQSAQLMINPYYSYGSQMDIFRELARMMTLIAKVIEVAKKQKKFNMTGYRDDEYAIQLLSTGTTRAAIQDNLMDSVNSMVDDIFQQIYGQALEAKAQGISIRPVGDPEPPKDLFAETSDDSEEDEEDEKDDDTLEEDDPTLPF